MALATARCAPDARELGDVRDSDEATLGTATSALTTPTGANLIVLPRPPARVSTIFTDTYAPPFVQAGTAVTVTPNTATKSEGTTSLGVTLLAATSELHFAIDPAQQTYDGVSQTELSFSFNPGATVNAGLSTLAIAVDDDDPATVPVYVTLKPLLTAGALVANTWYSATIPMSSLNPSNKAIRRVVFANKSGASNVSFLVDNVRLSWTDAAPTTLAVYADAAQNSFAAGGWSSTFASDPFRTTGASAVKASYTGAWGAFTLVYDWNKPAFPVGTFTTVQFDISPGATAVPAAMPSMYVGLDSDPQKALLPYIPGGFKANTWHRVTILCSDLVSAPYRYVTFKNQSFTTSYSFYVDNVSFQTDHAPPPLRTAPPPPPPPPGPTPDTFLAGEVDVETIIKTNDGLSRPISPLLYGLNGVLAQDNFPADVLKAATLIRRGGDRGNSYNWETNISNGSYNNNFTNDAMYALQPGPAAPDLSTITQNRAAGRATMVPFVLNDWVAGPQASNIPYLTAGWNKAAYFNRVGLVKPTAFAATPDLNDGMVYTDEHMAFMKGQFADDPYASTAGAGRVLVGIDNEPDLYHWNFPMLQEGSGDVITMSNGSTNVPVGKRVTAEEFTARMIKFAARAKTISPDAHVIGPSHYGFDGFTTWHQLENAQFQNKGHWYMDDFLASVKAESERTGVRLLDTWDFHWYPQPVINGTYVSALDNNQRAMTAAEIDAVVQGPRSYWDDTYDEGSWITQNMGGPINILNRTISRLATDYPGTKIGVSEYYPGGRNHIASGIAVVDTLGVFQRMGVNVAAMWPVGGNAGQQFAFGGLKLVRNADGAGLKFADTVVTVQHPERAPSSVYAGADSSKRVTVVVVNKTNAIRKFGLRAYNDSQLTNVAVYRIDGTHSTPYLATTDALTKNNAYAYAAPALSATMLVFTAP
ncbi:MAG: hypothetical protein QOI41_2077 [Myxococcales bacterium]|nr:hypothetical protein [Myxococcales bacterium]